MRPTTAPNHAAERSWPLVVDVLVGDQQQLEIRDLVSGHPDHALERDQARLEIRLAIDQRQRTARQEVS
jgi:hypothetical protein